MKPAIRFLSVLILGLFTVVSVQAWTDGVDPNPAVEAKDIEVTLVPDKPTIMIGEPIFVSLFVKNNSGHNIELFLQEDGASDERMASQTRLFAVDKAGAQVPAAPLPPPSPGPHISNSKFSRSESHPAVASGGTATLKFWLPWRIVFKQPGQYTLHADSLLAFNALVDDKKQNRIPVKVTAPLEIIPAEKEKMGKLIEELERLDLAAPHFTTGDGFPPGYAAALDARTKLGCIEDERVIPFYQELMHGPYVTEAISALAKFNTDAAFACLKEGMEMKEVIHPVTLKPYDNKDALADIHKLACEALLISPHPGALSYVVTRHDDPDEAVRRLILRAVATRLAPKEAIPILEEMQNDPVFILAGDAKFYLTNLKAGRPAVLGLNLRRP